MKILVTLTLMLLITMNVTVHADSSEEFCKLVSSYTALGYMDAKNNVDSRNRIQEINSKYSETTYRKDLIDSMEKGRSLYADAPNLNQGEIERTIALRGGCHK